MNLISPTSNMQPQNTMPQSVVHPSQAFGGPMPPPHPLMHHSFLFHSHPYSGYPFSYPYPYGPMPHQPQAIPPPQGPMRSESSIKVDSTTLASSQHSTTSSVTTRREIREPDDGQGERSQTHETTLTHHQSTAHHSAIHTTTDKQNYGGGTGHTISISHSTSSSSSQSVQLKVNQKPVRTNSPHTPVSQVIGF